MPQCEKLERTLTSTRGRWSQKMAVILNRLENYTVSPGCEAAAKESSALQKCEPTLQGGRKVKLICSMQVSSDRFMRL